MVWAISLAVALSHVAASGATILVLDGGQPPGPEAPGARMVAEALSGGEDQVELVPAADLEARLATGEADLLVIAGSGYPAVLREAVLAYLRGGGALLAVGKRPLSTPTYEADGGWRALGEASRDGAVELPAEGWQVNQDPEAPEASLARGEEASHVELRVPEGWAWCYAWHDLRGMLSAEHSVLTFWAKGDGTYDHVCLELNETDGSRWKAWVPVGDKWERHVLHTGDFLSYATKDRGEAGDFVHPERATGLSLGGYKALWGAGKHRLTIRDVAFLKCPVGGGRLGLLSAPGPLRAGLEISDTGGALPLWLDDRAATLQNLQMRGLSGGRLVVDLRRMSGWPVHADAAADAGRVTPILCQGKGAVAGADWLGTAARHFAGEYAGSRWAVVSLERPEEAVATAGPMTWLREVAAGLCSRGPMIGGVGLDAGTEGGERQVLAAVSVVNPTADGAKGEVKALLLPEGADPAEASANTEVAPGEKHAAEVRVPWPEGGLAGMGYGMSVELRCEGREADQLDVEVRPRQVLREAWEWLVSIQKPDGTFSDMYFVDAYAARALAGAARSGDLNAQAYLDAARRWADGMVERQREDGGWWVGYGPLGQEIYVADDGSIALGIACLYGEPAFDRPTRWLEALRKYMAFRESFRNADGSLGVGYTKTDYFAKPFGRFDEVQREMRGYPWTIGCSLGAAAAMYAITGEAADKERAIGDARYLIANAGSTGLAHGYYAEALALVHAWVDDEALRQEIEVDMQPQFAATLYKPDYPFWSSSEGRNCLSLIALAHWPGAESEAAQFRALAHLCRTDSPDSVPHDIQAHQRLTILTGFALCGVQEALGGLDTYPRQMPRAR